MNFRGGDQVGFQNYVNFSGRALRSEFWFWVLFAFIVSIVAGILDMAIFSDSDEVPIGRIQAIIGCGAAVLPKLAVGARRLHDIDRTGWWQLTRLLPSSA